MKFGLKLHHSGPGASPAYMLRWTRFAETLGLHLIMTADHADPIHGAAYVLLDTKRNSPTAQSSQHHEESWRVLTTLAGKGHRSGA